MPRWRQLSVSIISLISILVISLVVWLIVVFFSVTHGLEKNWIQKLIALTAPIRITPTSEYYDSYYYQIDGISANSDYTLKTIGEKIASSVIDPYDPSFDEEIPSDWHLPDLDEKNELKDILKIAISEIEKIQGVSARDYEMTHGNIRLRLLRDMPKTYSTDTGSKTIQNQSFLSQSVYFSSFDTTNRLLQKTLLPINHRDIANLLNTLSVSSDNFQEDTPHSIERLDSHISTTKLLSFLDNAEITQLQTPSHGWKIPDNMLPETCLLDCCIIKDPKGIIRKIIIPKESVNLSKIHSELLEQNVRSAIGKISLNKSNPIISIENVQTPLPNRLPLYLEGGIDIPAILKKLEAPFPIKSQDLKFLTNFKIQGVHFSGETLLEGLLPSEVKINTIQDLKKQPPYWIHQTINDRGEVYQTLPSDAILGESILLPKSFRDAGILVGDRGYISYQTPTTSSIQEQRIPVSVAGFYDPGVLPIGGKLVLTNPEVTSFIRLSQPQEESSLTNGINVRFEDLSRSEEIKAQLTDAFNRAGIGKYFEIQTYREYDFTKDIIQQLHSEKNLFSLLAIIIIIVACSNIISMLIILVNDKKIEIGILRSMGASSASIAAIFGLCGIIMGFTGSTLGIFFAIITLQNLQYLIHFLSSLQGHEMFNPTFYGELMPNEISTGALGFVIIMTILISTIAGIVPAIKACLIRPSDILRAE